METDAYTQIRRACIGDGTAHGAAKHTQFARHRSRESSMKFGAFCFAVILLTSTAAHAVDPESVLAPKRTEFGQYFSAQEAAGFLGANASKAHFLDVRSSAELLFAGMPKKCRPAAVLQP